MRGSICKNKTLREKGEKSRGLVGSRYCSDRVRVRVELAGAQEVMDGVRNSYIGLR